MAKLRIMQIMPHDSPMTSFLMPKIMAKFEWDHPLWWRQCMLGGLKFTTFDKKRAITRKRYKIDA